MARFRIKGGSAIKGTFEPRGNKNAVLPMLAASLLTDKPLTLNNIPLIDDVKVMLELLSSLGVKVHLDNHSVTLNASEIKSTSLDELLCSKVRTSILLAGPLTARHGSAIIFPPGGDVIGKRRLDTHFHGLRSLGVKIILNDSYQFEGKNLKGCDIILDEASVTATENIMMAAVLADGKTTIYNAACEPHVQDLALLLNSMGANIIGVGTNRLHITGTEELNGSNYNVQPDFIEIGSFIAAAVATGGELKIPGVGDSLALKVMERTYSRLGINWSVKDDILFLPSQSYRSILSDVGTPTLKIEDGIWPAFPSDLMSVSIVLATQTKGTTLFFEKMFESRMYFVDHLMSMGANIIQCDPHRVVVIGPTKLQASTLTSPDIRAGMAMLIAACCAEGESIIKNAEVIDRGYESIENRLSNLGANIIREK